MGKDKWVWMPHAGHFILGYKCRFRLNTYVNGYIISTVGEYIPDGAVIDICRPEFKHLKGDAKEYAYQKKYGCEEIGCGRKYETMVFMGQRSSHKCCPYGVAEFSELDFAGYSTPEDAYKGHMKMCLKFDKKDSQ